MHPRVIIDVNILVNVTYFNSICIRDAMLFTKIYSAHDMLYVSSRASKLYNTLSGLM